MKEYLEELIQEGYRYINSFTHAFQGLSEAENSYPGKEFDVGYIPSEDLKHFQLWVQLGGEMN